MEALLHETGEVTVSNVASYRSAANISVEVEGFGTVTGDVAWGGNWFFLTYDLPFRLELENLDALTDYTWRIRQALKANGIAGANGEEIDHIEVYGPPTIPGADSKNFVLCPGKSYDRSPCGTGTSAKMACLHADGKLREGQVWRQESLIGSIFEGSITVGDGVVYPHIKGSAFVNSEAYLVVDEARSIRMGHSARHPALFGTLLRRRDNLRHLFLVIFERVVGYRDRRQRIPVGLSFQIENSKSALVHAA